MKKRILADLQAVHKKSFRKKSDSTTGTLEDVVPVSMLNAEVTAWAKRIGVTPKEIRLRPLRRKWASCSRRGYLTFDTGLLQKPAQFRAKTIVHELLHLKVPNHGKLFKSLLKAYLAERGTEGPS